MNTTGQNTTVRIAEERASASTERESRTAKNVREVVYANITISNTPVLNAKVKEYVNIIESYELALIAREKVSASTIEEKPNV